MHGGGGEFDFWIGLSFVGGHGVGLVLGVEGLCAGVGGAVDVGMGWVGFNIGN